MQYKLINVEQGTTLIKNLWPKMKTALELGKTLVLNIDAETRSDDQNRLYHEIIGEIAEAAKHMGAKWDAESWKRFLIDQFGHETGLSGGKVVPSLDGSRIVQLGIQSRKFTKEQASQFIEWLYVWCAENEVPLKKNIHS